MNKKCKVVMLATDKKGITVTPIYKFSDKLYGYKDVNFSVKENDNIHLYILSDDEIKEGDWVCDTEAKYIRQLKSKHNETEFDKKIIATTNSSLMIEELIDGGKWSPLNHGLKVKQHTQLPSIPQSFIDKYVSEYNKGNKITEVMVEYEMADGGNSTSDEWDWIINPDNTINIQSVKDSWNREEVKQLFLKYIKDHNQNLVSEDDIKWIKDNLL